MKSNDKLYVLLQDIRERPELYLGKKSVERLCHFINGYREHETYTVDTVKNDWMYDLKRYIEGYYNLNTDHNWSSLMQFFSNTEEEAFDKFYEFFDEFWKNKTKED